MSKNSCKIIIILALCLFLVSGGSVLAASLQETANFNIDKDHDSALRSQIQASLIKVTPKLYVYVEKGWWDQQALAKQKEILLGIDSLSLEFENKIYPTLTSVFGKEWNPGVDGDTKITILFSQMKEGVGGYFREADEYIKMQVPDSNEREMFYLPVSQIDNLQLKVFVAHEFMHLIIFNQKYKTFNTQDETWLIESVADYSSTVLGYDDNFDGSNLQRRVNAFLEKPSDSLTEWQEKKYDYGSASMFFNYLVDHYGINILIDSLKSKYAGIESINYALKKSGTTDTFSDIYMNWTITVLINDCSVSLKYCYLNKNLKSLKISSNLNFLPLSGDSSLSVTNVTKNWSGSWQKIIGGNGKLTLIFNSLKGLSFKVPYIIFNKQTKTSGLISDSYSVDFLKLDENQKGQISIDNFGSEVTSLVIIPSLQSKISGFYGLEPTYPFSFTASIIGQTSQEDPALIKKLLDQIESLKKQIADILAARGNQNQTNSCYIVQDLYVGVVNSEQVKCLQTFLKSQGQDIYPEGLVTGSFANLTMQAVTRFQEKYKADILLPAGLQKATGYVGERTRQKINSLLVK